ncbi:transposase [Pseudomonas sp. IT-P100]
MARELAPAGLRNDPKKRDCYTVLRERAPSPQGIAIASNKKVERVSGGMLYTFKVFFDRMTFPTAEVSHDSHRQYRFRRRLSSQRTNR